ncbi:hypothetical protein DQR70_06005 [Salmonella enterica subsp. enterica serovar Oslo]|nr:hypothetical protein [Salmonella enterica subsp. enterica serovar Oslo]EEX4841309.1 hypothetical protein [Escherichia coli]ELF5188714.1 hypothetical protein [Salmonella enterica]
MFNWIKQLLRNPVYSDCNTMTRLSTDIILIQQEAEEKGINIDKDLLEEMEILDRKLMEWYGKNVKDNKDL